MTARASVLSAALLRAGLLAAVLAIVAGIFGMHVMTADHGSHASPHSRAASLAGAAHADTVHSAGDSAVAHSAAAHSAGHAVVGHPAGGHTPAGHPATQPEAGAFFTASQSCSSGCPAARESGASCIPSAKAGSLAVIPPPTGPAAHSGQAASTASAAGYSYVPSSPTPCELSISRT
jgi:hypothetical protein